MLKNRRYDHRKVIIAAVTAASIIAAMLVPLPASASAPQTRDLTVGARTFAYSPASIEVHRGDTVNLTLEAMDTVHGLSIDGYDLAIQAEPGKSAHTTFIADKEGKFKFRCSVSCGPLHPFMIGELVVDPPFPLSRSLAAVALATVGALAFFWKGL